MFGSNQTIVFKGNNSMADCDFTPVGRECTRCKEFKEWINFYPSNSSATGYRYKCKVCYAKIHKERTKDVRVRRAADKEAARIKTHKNCASCWIKKPVDEFALAKSRDDGRRPYCKECSNKKNKEYRLLNPETSAASSRSWARNNPERVNERIRRHYQRNSEAIRKRSKAWREANIDQAKASETKSSRKRRMRPEVRVHDAIGNQIRSMLASRKNRQMAFDIVGYTLEELMAHLERQFLRGMGWDNFGKWHIDHIVPQSSFSIDGPEDPEITACWALTNLRPLWAFDNLSKQAKRTHLI